MAQQRPGSGRRVLLAGARGSGACCQCWHPAQSLARREGIYLFFSKTCCTLSKTNYGELRQRCPVGALALEAMQEDKTAGESCQCPPLPLSPGVGPCSSERHLPAQLCREVTASSVIPASGRSLPPRRCLCGFGSKASSGTVDAEQFRMLRRAVPTAPLRLCELLWHFPCPVSPENTRFQRGILQLDGQQRPQSLNSRGASLAATSSPWALGAPPKSGAVRID